MTSFFQTKLQVLTCNAQLVADQCLVKTFFDLKNNYSSMAKIIELGDASVDYLGKVKLGF